MNRGSSRLKKFSHSAGQNWYHIVLTPRARYPIFQYRDQRDLMKSAITIVCKRHKINILAMEIMSDHAHFFLDCPPYYTIRRLVQIIKGGTSYFMRKYRPALKRYKKLWSKGYMYRTVGDASAATVKRYIEESNKWGH